MGVRLPRPQAQSNTLPSSVSFSLVALAVLSAGRRVGCRFERMQQLVEIEVRLVKSLSCVAELLKALSPVEQELLASVALVASRCDDGVRRPAIEILSRQHAYRANSLPMARSSLSCTALPGWSCL